MSRYLCKNCPYVTGSERFSIRHPFSHFRQVSIVLSRKKPPLECHCLWQDCRRPSNFSTFFRLSNPSGLFRLSSRDRTNKRCVNRISLKYAMSARNSDKSLVSCLRQWGMNLYPFFSLSLSFVSARINVHDILIYIYERRCDGGENRFCLYSNIVFDLVWILNDLCRSLSKRFFWITFTYRFTKIGLYWKLRKYYVHIRYIFYLK